MVADAFWSRLGGEDCVRLGGIAPEANVRVHAGTSHVVGELPPMAGRLVRDGAETCFVPRFAFLDGTTYTVFVDGVVAEVLVRPRPPIAATTEVIGIHPTASEVPRNLLRFYVHFSSPMSEGQAASHIRLVDDDGHTMAGALLATEHELWDSDRRRLTVLLDPARIKRGLIGHREVGYPLRAGTSFRLVVDDGFRDALGEPLRASVERRYAVIGDERRRVEPDNWRLTVPPSDTFEALDVELDRSLDYSLLARCLHIVGPDDRRVDGTPTVGAEERTWRFVPRRAWARGSHTLVIDSVLEDLAGNSVSRVFDRELARPQDEPRAARPVARAFHAR